MIESLKTILAYRRLRATVLCMLFGGALAASIAPYIGLIAVKTFGLSNTEFAILTVLSAINAVCISIYLGIITDQWASRRATAICCTTLNMLGFAVVFIWPNRLTFLFCTLITGPIGFSVMGQLFAIARVTVAEHTVDLRDRVMAVVRASFALSFVIVLPIWSMVFAQDADLIWIYMVCTGGAGGTLFALWFLMPVEGTEGGNEAKSGLSFRQSIGELLTGRVCSRLVLMATLVAANSVYMMTMGLLFESAHPDGTARTAKMAALIAGLEIPLMLLLPWFTARFTKSAVLFGSILIYGVFLLCFPTLAGTNYVWFSALPAAMGAAALLSIPIAYFQELLADRPGASASLLSVNQVSSKVIAGVVFWLGTSIGSYHTVMPLAAIFAISAGALLFALDRRLARQG